MIDKLQAHYGFTRMPFGRDLAPGMLAPARRPQRGLRPHHLCIAERAIGVITGEVALARPSPSAPSWPAWTPPGTSSSTCPTR